MTPFSLQKFLMLGVSQVNLFLLKVRVKPFVFPALQHSGLHLSLQMVPICFFGVRAKVLTPRSHTDFSPSTACLCRFLHVTTATPPGLLKPTISDACTRNPGSLTQMPRAVGFGVGRAVGSGVGGAVGDPVVGEPVGSPVGLSVGDTVGLSVGDSVGRLVGPAVGGVVGEDVGAHSIDPSLSVNINPLAGTARSQHNF